MELNDILLELTELAKKNNNSLTEEEVENKIDNVEDLMTTYEYLENLNIEVVKDDDVPDEKLTYSTNTSSLNLYMQAISKIPLLSAEEEFKYATLAKKGDRAAIDKLVESNLRLVVHVAKRYSPNTTQSLLDLVQEGNIGLMRAAERFDVDRGFKFSTYATYWIRQAISQSINDFSRTVRIPNNSILTLSKINKTIDALKETCDGEPSDEAIAEKLDLDPMAVHDLRTIALPTYSLDFIVAEDKETNAVDLIPDTNCVDPEEFANSESRRAGIIRILETLPPRDKEILTKRYGLITGIPATLDEIGQDLHLTRERVRQLEIKAMRKLRAPARVRALKEVV